MATAARSLRLMVEQWLSPDAAKKVRVTEFRHRRSTQECYVCVQTVRDGDRVTMLFFRHKDGTWRIYPRDPARPSMRAICLPTNLEAAADLCGGHRR